MYFCLWNLESWALESGIQPKWNNSDPTKDWDPGARSKIPTGRTGKSGPPQKVDPFFRNFSGWTKPIHWVLDRISRKFWLNGSRPFKTTLDSLTWGDNLVPRFHSVLRWKVGAIESLAVFILHTVALSVWTNLDKPSSGYVTGTRRVMHASGRITPWTTHYRWFVWLCQMNRKMFAQVRPDR